MQLLDILPENEYVSGQALAGRLGLSRAAVHKQVVKLRRRGYAIHAERNRGYLLSSRPDLLVPDELSRCRPAHVRWPSDIRHATEIASTQSTAKELAARGVPEGTLVVADAQTGGYGRLQREWASPEGGIWCSLVLRPSVQPSAVAQLMLVCSLSICRAIERHCGIALHIKWPNDLMHGDRKCAGILAEMSAEVGRLNWAVVGVGINVNNPLPRALSRHAVSLAAITGGPVRRAPLLAAILEDMERDYHRFCVDGFVPFTAAYNDHSALQGCEVIVDVFDTTVHGTVRRIDRDGALLLVCRDGSVHRVLAGTVTHVRRLA